MTTRYDELAARLRSTVYMDGSQGIEHEAADAIKALQAELEKTREALRQIANTDYRGNRSFESQMAAAALAAHGEKP